MNPQQAYERLIRHQGETALYASAASLLAWDQRTYLPPKGHAHRADQLTCLAKVIHARRTDPLIGEWLAAAENSGVTENPQSPEAVNVREWRREYDRVTKITPELAEALARARAEGESAWETAKPRSDWKLFRPYLEKLVALKREEAAAVAAVVSAGGDHYDALLDEFEPGETGERLERLFTPLGEALAALLDRVRGAERRPATPFRQNLFPAASQARFCATATELLGYDYEAGRLDTTAHPFTTHIGPGDVRITTRYNERDLAQGLFGAIHECGHALYEQGLPAAHWGMPMGGAPSLGIHESQSRLWENMVGRSRGFWTFLLPRAKSEFPVLAAETLDSVFESVNVVEAGFIRTEADEVTYNLHVIVRFELERALISGNLQTGDLPAAWEEKMRHYLGVTPPDHAHGVLQDIHWAAGAFGYFPTYTLGNLYAALFYAQAERELGNLDHWFERGEFAPLLGWLRSRVHSHGGRHHPRDLLKAATGEDLGMDCLIDHLSRKIAAVYKI